MSFISIESFFMAGLIVDKIRECILESIEFYPDEDADPWDEEKNGVAWLENELQQPLRFLKKLNPNKFYPDPNWNLVKNVDDIKSFLATFSFEDLRFIEYIIRKYDAFSAKKLSLDEIRYIQLINI